MNYPNPHDYFKFSESYFWKRQQDPNEVVLTIIGGNTILYEPFLLEILEQCNANGLPPMGTMLLLIVATNNEPEKNLDKIKWLLPELYLEDVEQFLNMLASLPKAYKTGENRLHILRGLSDVCHRKLSVKNAVKALESYKSLDEMDQDFFIGSPMEAKKMEQEFDCISRYAKRFPTQDDLFKYLTTLPNVPEEFIEELNELDMGEDYVERLLHNPKTYEVAALVDQIQNLVNMPFHSSKPSAQSIGGYADITNKGDYDKLLISEFANDDLILMSRLANSEALFIQKETPPVSSDQTRYMLVDLSIRNWGIPKLISYALALANVSNMKNKFSTQVIGIGDDWHELHLNSTEGLIRALGEVDVALDASLGLDLFLESDTLGKDADVWLISAKDALNSPDWRAAIQRKSLKMNGFIEISRNGALKVDVIKSGRRKTIQQLTLPLQRLWSNRPVKSPSRSSEGLVHQYPILFYPGNSYVGVQVFENYVYLLSKEGGFFRSFMPTYKDAEQSIKHTKKYGVEMLKNGLPKKFYTFAIGKNEYGELILLICHKETRKVKLININSNEQTDLTISTWKNSQFVQFMFYDNHFWQIGREGELWQISTDGRINAVKNETITDELRLNSVVHWPQEGSVLKNIRTVFIDEDRGLCFNTHRLRINSYEHMAIAANVAGPPLVEARSNRQGSSFTFADGSRIIIDRNGMYILESSSEEIPTIYIPATLDSSLGMATENDFAGNTTFLNSSKWRVKIRTTPPNIEPIKNTLTVASRGVLGLDSMQHGLPNLLPLLHEDEARRLEATLTRQRCRVEIKAVSENVLDQNLMSPQEFFETYIDRFIDVILSHGN